MSRVSVVVPMHATVTYLDELLARIANAMPDAEVVLVDDACPEGSGAAALGLAGRLPGRLRCRLVSVRPGVGQHSAVLLGLAESTAPVSVVMDADLQDPPEAIPVLVNALISGCAPVVAAGRRGSYQARGRLVSGRWHRRALHLASRGRVPRDAGMFLAMTASARDAVLALDDPVAPLLPALTRAGMLIRTVPVLRAARIGGGSATTRGVRVRTSVRGLLTVLPLHPFVRSVRVRRWQQPNITVTDIGGHR